MVPPLRIQPEPLTSPVACRLIEALNVELSERYPEEGANHFRLDPDEVAHGRGVFLVAYQGLAAVGCGALRRTGTGTGEIKRMYVVPSARGQHVATALLSSLEAEARALAMRRLILETGVRQHEALALYRRAGFETIPVFGGYVDSPLSFCMAKTLTKPSH